MMPRYNVLEAAYLNTPAESVTERGTIAATPPRRREFEAWIASAMPDVLPLERNFDDYQRVGTQMAWAAWQAARRPVRELTDEEIVTLFDKQMMPSDQQGLVTEYRNGAPIVAFARALLSKATGEAK